jgi:hypothetical protein
VKLFYFEDEKKQSDCYFTEMDVELDFKKGSNRFGDTTTEVDRLQRSLRDAKLGDRIELDFLHSPIIRGH